MKGYSRLYRRSLKLALDWAVHRHLWRGQAMYIRSLFEANKHVREPRQQRVRGSPRTIEEAWKVECILNGAMQALFEQTEQLLERWKHPDPYRPPTAPGGSKYERNLPAPILDRTSPRYHNDFDSKRKEYYTDMLSSSSTHDLVSLLDAGFRSLIGFGCNKVYHQDLYCLSVRQRGIRHVWFLRQNF